ncbi:unnamed protein product [Allacma fusca]|uniref:Gustatory receptor n=1 Tax=Allacma fusca TaxID=39272 RepID=A0A8J2KXG2_9HEXA|nr:unnamed protein product [Allacma fusca]
MFKHGSNMPLSQQIMEYLVSVNAITTCVVLRSWKLLRCSQITNLILQVINLKRETGFKKGSYIYRYYFLGHLIFFMDFIPTGFLLYEFGFTNEKSNFIGYDLGSGGLDQNAAVWVGFLYRIFIQFMAALTRYFSLAIIVFLGVHLLHVFENFCFALQTLYCPEAVSNVHIIQAGEEEDTENDSDDGMSSHENPEVEDFSNKLPTVLCNHWKNALYKSKKIRAGELELKVTISKVTQGKQWATNVTGFGKVYTLKDLSEKFLEIQRAFDDYNKVAGMPFFVLICHATLSLIHKLYFVATSEFTTMKDHFELARFLSKSLVGFIVISSLSHLGEVIVTRMRKWKEQLKCVMLNELLCDKSHDPVNTLVESVVKWDWGLKAINLFNINHALLPAIAGTMVTYLIVIIQLEISESSSQNSTQIAGTPNE